MVYADNASTTKMSESVLAKMLPFLQEQKIINKNILRAI